MRKIIYFKNNDLVKGFCGEDALFLEKDYFAKYANRYREYIVVCYGIVNYEMITVCINNGINFIYIDNSYFGTMSSYYTKEKCRKNFYRVVANSTCLRKIIDRDDDRLKQQLNFLKENYGLEPDKYIENYKYDGKEVLIIPPSGKVREICKIDDNVWIQEVVDKVKQQTNLTPNVRLREKLLHDRFIKRPIQEDLKNAYATVTFNSNAAVESIIFGVPSFIYNPTNNKNHEIYSAAKIVSRKNLDDLNDRLYPEERYKWLCHLAYGQFSREEMASGFAKDFILASFK